MCKLDEKTAPLSPERQAARPLRVGERQLLSKDERSVIRALERDLGRWLTREEERLALEQARALGEI
jgi:hypothetical protein